MRPTGFCTAILLKAVRAPGVRQPSRLEYYRPKKSENLNGMQWTG
jgi:hypothetical protein